MKEKAIRVNPAFQREVVRGDLPMVWGEMTYRCNDCGRTIQVQLAVGCEGPKELKTWMPVPFTAICDNCHRFMNHINFWADKEFEPKKAEPGYIFIPDREYGCGKLVIYAI
jgi:hypothetical protein